MHAKHPKTKSSKKWIIFPIIFLVGICCYLVINARDLIFTDISDTNSNLKGRFSGIHFTSLGNDFGGGVFRDIGSTSGTNNDTIITLDGHEQCVKMQIPGLYYNDARGARLWPLDQGTLKALQSQPGSSYNDLSMEGGFYRSCSNSNIIYGSIKYTLGNSESWLIAGVKLDYDKNQYQKEFATNLQYFNKETPLGYIWDSYGGIGFIGGKLDGTGCASLLNYLNTGSIQQSFHLDENGIIQLNSGFLNNCGRTPANGNAKDIWNLLIQGNTILSTTISSWEKTALLGAIEEKTVLLSSSDINSATIMNAAKKNAGSLCRGKTILDSTDGHNINDDAGTEDVLCYEDAPNLTLDLGNWNYEGKSIIVNSGNITLTGTMGKDTPAIDIFVDGGNMYLSNLSVGSFSDFNIQGFPTEIPGDVKNQGRFLKGNFVINGLLLGGVPNSVQTIINKLHIYGKFVSLNTPLTVSDGRAEQVKDVLGSDVYLNRISFKNILTWDCAAGGNKIASDGTTPCGEDSEITSIPFVILDGNFPSKIIK